MKIAGWLILFLIGVVSAYYAYEHFTQKPDEEIQRLESELSDLKAKIIADSAAQVLKDSIHAAKVRELTVTADSAKEAATAHADTARALDGEVTRLGARLIELIGSHPVLDSLLAAHRAQVRSYERALVAYGTTIASQDSIIADLTINRDDYKKLNNDLRDALARSEELKEYWKKEANPPFYVELWGDLPKLLVAGGFGYLIGKS